MSSARHDRTTPRAASSFRLTAALIERRIAARLERAQAEPGHPPAAEASSETVNLAELLSIPNDEEFLREAYRRILRRECDMPGFIHYRELLRRKLPRRMILRALATSPEARQTGLRYTGLSPLAPSLTSAPKRLLEAGRRLLWRWLGQARWLYDALWLRPVELVGAKVDYLLQELQVRTEQLSVKTDALCRDQHAAAERVAKLEAELKEQIAGLRQALRNSRSTAPVLVAGDGPFVINLEGLLLAVPRPQWRLAAQLALRGPLEPGVLKRFRRLVRPGMVVADVGAYLGHYTLEAARRLAGRGKIYSFEPNPETFGWLRENVRLNGWHDSGLIELRQAALAQARGTALLYLTEGEPGRDALFPETAGGPAVPVETVTLDEALEEETHLDLVHMDVESAEGLVLEGMSEVLERNPGLTIIMKFAPCRLLRAGTDPDQLLRKLEELDFSVQLIDPVSGDLSPAGPDQLHTAPASTLLLSRRPSPQGGSD